MHVKLLRTVITVLFQQTGRRGDGNPLFKFEKVNKTEADLLMELTDETKSFDGYLGGKSI